MARTIKTLAATRRPLCGVFDFVTRGWRPAAGWACGATIFIRGAVLPIVEIVRGDPASPFDWVAVTALCGVLGLGAFRSFEKSTGATV